MKRTSRQLRVQRETVRELTDSHLARVAGGFEIPTWDQPTISRPTGPGDGACPAFPGLPIFRTERC